MFTAISASQTGQDFTASGGGSGDEEERIVRFGGGGGALDYTTRAALGIGFERVAVELTPAEIADPDSLDFMGLDSRLAVAQPHDIREFGVLNIRAGGTWPDPVAFGAAVGRYVERYDGDGTNDMPGLLAPIRHWEVFNEYTTNFPDYAACPVTKYAAYLTNAWLAAHAADPDVTILCSAVVAVPDAEPGWYWQDLLKLPGITAFIDAVNYHSYEALSWTTVGGRRLPQYLMVRDVLGYLAAHGLGDREVWATETDFVNTYARNGSTASQADNARWLAQAYPFALACGVDHLCYTELEYDSHFPAILNWAVLTDSSGNRRMSFYVYQQMMRKLEHFERSHLLEDLGNGNLGGQFIVKGQPAWVLWNYSNLLGTVRLPVGPVAAVRVTGALPVTFDNATSTWSVVTLPVSNGYALVNTSSNAVYVEPTSAIASDLDGDGLANDLDDDLDGDGMPNTYEAAHGLNVFDAADAAADSDGDGVPNGDEWIAGTAASDRGSVLRIDDVAPAGGGIVVQWASVSGRVYAVQCGGRPGAWSNAAGGAAIAGDGAPRAFTNASGAAAYRFYRLKARRAP